MQELDPYRTPAGRVEDPVDRAAHSLARRGQLLTGTIVVTA